MSELTNELEKKAPLKTRLMIAHNNALITFVKGLEVKPDPKTMVIIIAFLNIHMEEDMEIIKQWVADGMPG